MMQMMALHFEQPLLPRLFWQHFRPQSFRTTLAFRQPDIGAAPLLNKRQLDTESKIEAG